MEKTPVLQINTQPPNPNEEAACQLRDAARYALELIEQSPYGLTPQIEDQIQRQTGYPVCVLSRFNSEKPFGQ